MHKDPTTRKEYTRNYYLRNSEIIKTRTKEYQTLHPISKEQRRIYSKSARRRKVEWFRSIKSQSGCIKCGENDIRCLDFHHRDTNEKDSNVSRMLVMYGKQRILKEMEKCDILCANCHRKEHFKGGDFEAEVG
jgi:hypothetical protein